MADYEIGGICYEMMSLQCLPYAMPKNVTLTIGRLLHLSSEKLAPEGTLRHLRKVSTALAKSALRPFLLWLDVDGVPGFLRDTLAGFLTLHR